MPPTPHRLRVLRLSPTALHLPAQLTAPATRAPAAAETNDSTIFNALTLLVVLGTSLITQLAGLSLALGAFLAGLLLAETEYHLQVRRCAGLGGAGCTGRAG